MHVRPCNSPSNPVFLRIPSEAAPQTDETCSKSPDFSRTPTRHTGSSLVPLVHETALEIRRNREDPRRSRSLAEEMRRQAGLAPDRAQRSLRDIIPIGSGDRHHPGSPIDDSLETTVTAALPGEFKTIPLQDTYDLTDLHLRLRSSLGDRRAVCLLRLRHASRAKSGTTHDSQLPSTTCVLQSARIHASWMHGEHSRIFIFV